MLRAKKPSTIEKRLKMMLYGVAGVGKTTAAIQFPNVYLIDLEHGAEQDQYTKILEQNGGVIFQTTDYDEVVQEIKSLLTTNHPYKTLVLDPLTTVFNSLLDQAEAKVGSEFGRHYGEANKKMKRLIDLLMRLDMNIIVTSHAKNEYGDGMKVIGQTFDGYKKLDYLFDLVLELQKRGKDRFGVVKKSRIKAFEEMESFLFSYDILAEKYGKEVIEKSSAPQELAHADQIAHLKHLIEILKIDSETISKWLDKAQASSFEEMEAEKINSCIKFLELKITPKGE